MLRSYVGRMGVVALSVFAVTATGEAAEIQKPDRYPERSVTMIIPFGPGGGSDQMARAIGDEMAKVMGEGFRYVNKPGAGGLAALPDFAVAPADGYTVLQHHDGIVSGLAAGKHNLEIGEDIVPICIVQSDFSQIFIRSEDERFSDWKSLVDYAKETGETLDVAASSGQGSHEHTTVTQIAEGAGIDMEVVPFGDPGERVSAILGGHVDLYYEQPGDANPYVESGKLTPVLSVLKERPKQFDDIPALTDVGLTFEPTFKFRGLWTRPDMPSERRTYLQNVCKEAWGSDAFQAYLEEKFTHVISQYYNSEEALKLANTTLGTYRDMFEELGIVE